MERITVAVDPIYSKNNMLTTIGIIIAIIIIIVVSIKLFSSNGKNANQ